MNIEEIIQPGEIVLYNSKSRVTNQKIYRFIFLLLSIIDAVSFYFLFEMEDISTTYKLFLLSALFLLFIYFLCGFIINMYRANNNTSEYWITNLRVIAIQRNKNVIINNVADLSSINVLKYKKNYGSILLMFDIDDKFVDNFIASLSNRKNNNHLIRLNSVDDPMKAVRILKNINEDAQIMNDNINWKDEDDEEDAQ